MKINSIKLEVKDYMIKQKNKMKREVADPRKQIRDQNNIIREPIHKFNSINHITDSTKNQITTQRR